MYRQEIDQMEISKSENKPIFLPIVLVLFGFALLMRMVQAESIPFTRADANLAWQALEISKLHASGTSPLALYTGLTGVLFWISAANNFFARLVPAVFGASLALIPFGIFKQKNPKVMLGLTLLLTLDSILIIYSRQLNGPILAISTLAWTLVFLHQRKQVTAGITFGMAILSGKYFWIAILLTLLGLLMSYLSDKKQFNEKWLMFERPGRLFFISALISCVLISSSFFLNPAGLTGIASSLVDLFSASSYQSLPLVLPVFVLLTYSLYLLLPFGMALTKESCRSRNFLLGNLLILLVLTTALQNQIPGLYAFVELFLLFVIAKVAISFKAREPASNLVSLVAFVFFTVILVFTLLSFTQFAQNLTSEISLITDLLPIFLSLALIMISYILIGLGWGFGLTRPALEVSVLLVFTFSSLGFSLSQTWNEATTSQLLFSNSEILFPDSPVNKELSVFIENKVLNPSTASYEIDKIVSVGDNWVFKEFYSSKNSSSLPTFIINDSVTESGLMTAYRGSSITYSRRLNFSDNAYAELIHMIASKTLPLSDIKKTLWLQTTLFPGGK
jgi:hypothetical protein